jgi:hypothetical protein
LKELSSLWRNLSDLPGKRLKHRILVIESDDWGSIRMPSVESFKRLEKSGLDLRSADAERYNMNDTLASVHDLENLFEVLSNNVDSDGNPAIITPITIVANPDFYKIEKFNYKEYFYEPFTETLNRCTGCEQSFTFWKQGIESKLFAPQMHGREHLNVIAWMNALQAGDKHAKLAFKEGMWGFVPVDYPKVDYQAAYLLSNPNEIEYQKKVITEGLKLFEKIFGYKASYFVPPNGPFSNNLNKTLAENGVKLRSTAKIQYEPLGFGKIRKVYHYLGQSDKSGIRYITRNGFFEPSQSGNDWIDSCLNDIKIAFRWHKPAIISSHRVNYIGSLNPSNRDNGLRQLNMLLHSVLKHWPDIAFMSTAELGNLLMDKP